MVAESTALVPYDYTGIDRTLAWAQLADDERKRQAVKAAHEHDGPALWDLTESWLLLHGKKGAAVSPRTLDAYRSGVRIFLPSWRSENLLHPSRMAGVRWLRELETTGRKPCTVQVYLAAARALYHALRGVEATDVDPFRDVSPAPDPVPPEEKRQPYSPEDVTALLKASDQTERLIVLLGAHAGLRNCEMQGLQWEDVDLDRGTLTVLRGKGGKQRSMPLTTSLQNALYDAAQPFGYVLPTLHTRWSIALRMKKLCAHAGVTYRAVHSLRHAAGTRLVSQGNSLQDARHFLGHSSVVTTQIYITYADTGLRAALQDW